MTKKLIINADDYGICPEVNQAIENLIKLNKLRNVSVLANSFFLAETVEFLLNHPSCSVGIHLNTVEGVSLLPNEQVQILLNPKGQFADLQQILFRWVKSPFAVTKAIEAEWRRQIEVLLNQGLRITHADSHQHIHAFPPFAGILSKLCCEYKIPCLRLPGEKNRMSERRLSAFFLRQSSNLSKKLFLNRQIIINQNFLGFKRAGTYGENEMISDLKTLKSGLTELIFHPSIQNGIPYKELNGELEYEALLGEKLWEYINESDIQLVTWNELAETNLAAL